MGHGCYLAGYELRIPLKAMITEMLWQKLINRNLITLLHPSFSTVKC